MLDRRRTSGKVLFATVALLALQAAFPMHRCVCSGRVDAGAAIACCAGHACCCVQKGQASGEETKCAAPCQLLTYTPVPAPMAPVTQVAASMPPALDWPVEIGSLPTFGICRDIPLPSGDCSQTERYLALHVFLI